MALYIKELQIVSPAFTSLERIPKRYTSEGENISPPLEWSGLPPGTQQLALICHDPDAPLTRGFTHWVIYSIPLTASQMAEAGGSKFTEGTNSAEQLGYIGPAPPVGHGPHHYYFWLYALDKELDLKPGLNREQLLDAIAEHVIEQARLVGVYER
ncbi:YbhB/YbcL family Raf kinase inhibitor-like protein [Chroococcidiopsis sp. CCMEE 29]|uniref:YbhB/YbcL family Raf kinase inhibitor-like protein n=1 Tax=Chroococcidiopsis sp. CCMEE 29 TaxID=155894 RepID=UPI002020896D|nr:YbhB/YbcL family Raf kinase inhibitor-like protein [Chroococcidiopsis sp. CCMEE 29]